MKTILFLLDRYPAFGGIETVTTVLANHLAEHYRIIICSAAGDKEHELLHRLDSRISFRRLPRADKRTKEAALGAILAEEGVHVVIFQDSYAPNQHLAHYIKHRGGIKLIVAEHNSPSLSRRWVQQLPTIPWWDLYHLLKLIYFNGKGHLLTVLRRTRLYKICDCYIVLSENLKEEVKENSFIRDEAKLRAIGNPVSYEVKHINLSTKKKHVLFIGQFVPIKGIDRLLNIWKRVENRAEDWSLVLVGDGPQMPAVQEQLRRLSLQRVRTEGFCTNIRDYCTDASILCLCSLFEGFPMVLPEAMSSGAVPICFNSFAALENIITDGISGCSIPAFDEEAFASRLLQLMQDDDLRERMAHAAMEAAKGFDPISIAEKWRSLIESL